MMLRGFLLAGVGLLGCVAIMSSPALFADGPASIAGAGQGNWTTPPQGRDAAYATTAAPRYLVQEAPRPATVSGTAYYGAANAPSVTPAPLPGTTLSGGPVWSGQTAHGTIRPVPAAEVTAGTMAFPSSVSTEVAPSVVAPTTTFASEGLGAYPAPPPGSAYAAAPATTTTFADTPATTTVVGTATPRCGTRVPVNPTGAYGGCGLPCMQGVSDWHIRGVVGRALFEGDDPAEDCTYFGADIGRTFCGCWGLDAYYRYNSGRFDRVGFTDDAGNIIDKDGGTFHHFGLKLTMERGFGRNSNFFWWAGLGAGYFFTEDYIDDDEGVEYFGELGLGYMVNRNFRIRGGVNVHAMDTSVGRRSLADQGQDRLLWIIAPVIEAEFDF